MGDFKGAEKAFKGAERASEAAGQLRGPQNLIPRQHGEKVFKGAERVFKGAERASEIAEIVEEAEAAWEGLQRS